MDDTMHDAPLTMQGGHETLRNTRDTIAGGFDSAADTLRDKADAMTTGRMAGITDKTANALDATGRYVREMSTRNIVDDLTQITKDNPGKALLVAMALGLLVGKSMTRSQA